MKQLNRLRADAAVPEALRRAAERLSTKVDREHRLPFEADALEDAGAIIEWALPENDEPPGKDPAPGGGGRCGGR